MTKSMLAAELSHTAMEPSPTVTTQSSGGGVAPALYISVGVICAVLTSAIIVLAITLRLCWKRKKSSMNTGDNVAYGVNQNVVDISDNVAYGMNQNVVDISDNVAYGMNQTVVDISDNVAYGMNQNVVDTSDNVAYGVNQTVVDISDNFAYVASTSGDKDKVAEPHYDYVLTTEGNDIITTSQNEGTKVYNPRRCYTL